MDRLFRCAPESRRLASLREWNSCSGRPDFVPQNAIPEHSEIPQPAGSENPNLPEVPGAGYSPASAPPSPGDLFGDISEVPVSPQISGQPFTIPTLLPCLEQQATSLAQLI